MTMKKGSHWKRVFIHTDGKTVDSCTRLLDEAGIEFYVRQMPIWGSGTRRTRKYEHHVFVPRVDTSKANNVLLAAGLVLNVVVA